MQEQEDKRFIPTGEPRIGDGLIRWGRYGNRRDAAILILRRALRVDGSVVVAVATILEHMPDAPELRRIREDEDHATT